MNLRATWQQDVADHHEKAVFWAQVTALPGGSNVTVLFPGSTAATTIPKSAAYINPAVGDNVLVLKSGTGWIALAVVGQLASPVWATVTALPGGSNVTVATYGTIPKLKGYTPTVGDSALLTYTPTGWVALGVVG